MANTGEVMRSSAFNNTLTKEEQQELVANLASSINRKVRENTLTKQEQMQLGSELAAALARGSVEMGDVHVAVSQPDGVIPGGPEEAMGLGDQAWHLYSNEELMSTLSTAIEGLTTNQHEAKLARFGKNLITPPPKMHWFVKFLRILIGGFQLMLWVGAVLCYIVYGLSIRAGNPDNQTFALAWVLVIVVFVTSIFQSYQEGKSDDTMAALQKLTATTVWVYRDGTLQNVLAETLVPGDIVKVTGGEKVPADVRVITSSDLKVNNASLTGENVDIKLGPLANHEELYEAKKCSPFGLQFH